jgi:RNA polymerase sigma-B factor
MVCEGEANWEEATFMRYQRTGDPAARAELVDRFMPLARNLARRYEQCGEPFEDLVQVANLALVKAVDRFDPARGLRFTSYAVPTILGELKRYFRDAGWALHVDRRMQERVIEVMRAIDYLAAGSGRSPTSQELSAYLGLPVEQVIEALGANAAHETVSLETPTHSDDEGTATLGDTFGEIDRRYDVVEDTASISRAIRALPERERSILLLRFNADLTQREIAEEFGLSQMHVSRLISQALERLRTVSCADGYLR